MKEKLKIRQIVESVSNLDHVTQTVRTDVEDPPARTTVVEPATAIRQFLEKQDKPLSVQEIAEQTNLPATEVSAVLEQLVGEGSVTKVWTDWSYVFYWSR